jgi:hypothetical protein
MAGEKIFIADKPTLDKVLESVNLEREESDISKLGGFSSSLSAVGDSRILPKISETYSLFKQYGSRWRIGVHLWPTEWINQRFIVQTFQGSDSIFPVYGIYLYAGRTSEGLPALDELKVGVYEVSSYSVSPASVDESSRISSAKIKYSDLPADSTSPTFIGLDIPFITEVGKNYMVVFEFPEGAEYNIERNVYAITEGVSYYGSSISTLLQSATYDVGMGLATIDGEGTGYAEFLVDRETYVEVKSLSFRKIGSNFGGVQILSEDNAVLFDNVASGFDFSQIGSGIERYKIRFTVYGGSSYSAYTDIAFAFRETMKGPLDQITDNMRGIDGKADQIAKLVGSDGDLANAAGSVHAKLKDMKSVVEANLGSNYDLSNAEGSVHAKLKDMKSVIQTGVFIKRTPMVGRSYRNRTPGELRTLLSYDGGRGTIRRAILSYEGDVTGATYFQITVDDVIVLRADASRPCGIVSPSMVTVDPTGTLLIPAYTSNGIRAASIDDHFSYPSGGQLKGAVLIMEGLDFSKNFKMEVDSRYGSYVGTEYQIFDYIIDRY